MSSSSSGLSQLVADLQQAALLDSRGTFSIDFRGALRKMGRQLLPDARMYILRLVQSAVSAGCDRLDVHTTLRALQLCSFGPPVSVEQLRNLGNYLFEGEGASPARYLAQAAHAALSLKPEHLQILTWDGQVGANLRFAGQDESFQELTECPFHSPLPQTWVLIGHRQTWFFRQMPELEWLRKNCCYAPLELTLNQQPVTPAFGQRKDLNTYQLYLPYQYVSAHHTTIVNGKRQIVMSNCERGYHPFEGYGKALPTDSNAQLLKISPTEGRKLTLDGFARGWELGPPVPARSTKLVRAAVGLRADLRPKGRLRPVLHGVVLQDVELAPVRPGVEAVITAAGLKTDLSGTAIVRDDAFEARTEEVIAASNQLWESFFTWAGSGRAKLSYRDAMAVAISGKWGSTYHNY